jgi:colicin import membrane protein
VSFPRTKPGLPISAAAHAGLLAATLIAFAQAPKFAETPETVPIEVLTDQQLNQIMKGEKTARAVKPAQRAEKVAEQVETHPHPPQAEAKRDIPTPPPSFKRVAEPNADDAPEKPVKEPPTPPKRVAALTPEPPTRPAPAPKPVPAPPVKPQAKAAPEPDEDKPDDAEVVKPKPPVKPKLEKVEKETPTPPKPTEKPKEAPRLKTDEVAKLLQQKKLDKKMEKAEDGKEAEKSDNPKSAESKSGKPKSGDESAPKSKFSAANIANLLSHEAPQQRASTGRERTQLASLGAPTATAAKMSPSLQGRIDSYTVEHYRKCWATALSMNAMSYVPRVEFRLSPVGALEGEPRLLNPSSNPIEKARGEQALAAVRRCSPMQIPAEFTPYYDYWRVTELDMKEDM